MSWADNCGNCGSHRADCDCGDFSIVRTVDRKPSKKSNKKPMGTTNMSNENIDAIKEYTQDLDTIIENRNKLIELSKEMTPMEVDISIGSKSFCVATLGSSHIIDYLISLSNTRINELKKCISDALYPTKNNKNNYE